MGWTGNANMEVGKWGNGDMGKRGRGEMREWGNGQKNKEAVGTANILLPQKNNQVVGEILGRAFCGPLVGVEAAVPAVGRSPIPEMAAYGMGDDFLHLCP